MAHDSGESWEIPYQMNRAQSQGSIIMSQDVQNAPHSRPGTADPLRGRPGTAATKGRRRPRSRGSTASIQSSTTQQTQDQQMGDGFSSFIASHPGPGPQNSFTPTPEDMIMRYGQQLTHSNTSAPLDTPMHDAHGLSRGEDFHHNVGVQPHSMPEMVPHSLPVSSVPQYAPMYDGSGMDTQVSTHIVDEHENSETGSRRKRGSSSSLANDNELRKLLRQYEGYSLKQMAQEVQKHEGSGGKAEKYKQVFAMLWLKENCRKSNGSVRRDRVYCCYAERCGIEHVSVLNPASFGKLVRIIFPNVQTRRLGVRGESKYHYVDLTVIEEKQQPPLVDSGREQSGPMKMINSSTDSAARPRSTSTNQVTIDSAVFPPPSTSFSPKFPGITSTAGCACGSQFRSSFDFNLRIDNLASQTSRIIRHLHAFPSSSSTPIDSNESLRLPDVRGYLPENTDPKVADALVTLYRTHCISVIDSFRFCKERNMMRHFTAFHGTLTVPVQKLLTHPKLAPWIRECDWLMYQKMIEFVAPLTTQVVPRPVLDAFGSISRRLPSHIMETFKAHPQHVTLARLIPAHIFSALLKHVLDVNQSANAAAAWLCHPDNRNQMWLDFATFVDPREMISKADIPACSERAVEQILLYDLRALLTPLDSSSSPTMPTVYSQSQGDTRDPAHRVPEAANGEEYNFPDKWISFILNLPSLFPNHPTQCIVEKIDRLWDAILHRLTLAGAQSFSAWWMTKVFFHEMLLWQVERGGFLKHTGASLEPSGQTTVMQRGSFSSTGETKDDNMNQHNAGQQSNGPNSSQPSGNQSDNQSMTQSQPPPSNLPPTTTITTTTNSSDTNEQHAKQSPPSSTQPPSAEKPLPVSENNHLQHDDSGIDLGEDSMLMSVGKYDMVASDAPDAEGDVVVI